MAKKILTDDGEIIDAPIASGQPLFFKTPFNHDVDAEAARTAWIPKGKTMTQQNLAEEQEMKTILARFAQTGQLTLTADQMEAKDVQEQDLLDVIVTREQVMDAWDKLPVRARAILRTPQAFVEYMNQIDEDSVNDLVDMGLATRKAPQAAPEPPKPPTPPGGTPAPGPAAPPTPGPAAPPTPGPAVT